jgi:hypothetical protein
VPMRQKSRFCAESATVKPIRIFEKMSIRPLPSRPRAIADP